MSEDSVVLAIRAAHGDRIAEAELLECNRGLVISLAKRLIPRCRSTAITVEDLFQLGYIGLIKAARMFSADYGVKFSTYAVPKILGEMRRGLRDDGIIKVSRADKENAVRIAVAREHFIKGGHEPTLSELSEVTGLEATAIASAECAERACSDMLYGYGSDDEGNDSLSSATSGNEEDELVIKLALESAVDKLPEKENAVIRLRYAHSLTQQKTAKLLGMSQVQVSRTESKAIARLRALLNGQ